MAVMEKDKLERLLRRSFSADVFNNRTGMALYIENPLRLISLSAYTSDKETEAAVAKFNNRHRLLGDKTLKKSACKLGYCQYAEIKDPRAIVGQLSHPGKRLLSEIFWFYLPQDTIDELKALDSLGSKEARNVIRESFRNSSNGNETLVRHAMAVAYHTAAMESEAKALLGEGKTDRRLWQQAHKFWVQTFADEAFWQHLEARRKSINDFRLTSKDVDSLRVTLPRVILSFNSIFADIHGDLEREDDRRLHFQLLVSSKFPKDTAKDVLKSAVIKEIDDDLRPLVGPLQVILNGSNSDATIRQDVDKTLETIVEVYGHWKQFKLPEDMLESPVMNNLAEHILRITNEKLDYKGSGLWRNVLYCMLAGEKLLAIPHSSAIDVKLTQDFRKKRGILYPKDAHLPDSISPTKCWFIKTEPADPESSIQIKMYGNVKVVGDNVMFSQREISVKYSNREILVPRSKLAADCHCGRISKSKAKEMAQMRFAAEQSELAELKTERRKIADTIRQKYAKEIEAAKEKAARELKDFIAEQDKQENSPQRKAEIQKAHSMYLSESKGNQAERSKALKDIADEHAKKLAKHDADTSPGKSMSARIVTDLIAGAVGCVVGGLGITAITNILWFRGKLVGEAAESVTPSTIAPWHYASAIAALLAICCSELIMRSAGSTKRRKEKQRLALIRQYEKDKSEIHLKHDQIMKDLKAALTAEKEKNSRVIKERGKRLEDEKQKALKAIEQKSSKEISSKTAKLDAKLKKIERSFSVDINGENAKNNFPALSNAKKKGFKEGAKPSQYEINALADR
ncbi:hypothetical protein ACFL1X_00770 [Candidatus Hydrogenedentota bacterium]